MSKSRLCVSFLLAALTPSSALTSNLNRVGVQTISIDQLWPPQLYDSHRFVISASRPHEWLSSVVMRLSSSKSGFFNVTEVFVIVAGAVLKSSSMASSTSEFGLLIVITAGTSSIIVSASSSVTAGSSAWTFLAVPLSLLRLAVAQACALALASSRDERLGVLRYSGAVVSCFTLGSSTVTVF